MKEDRLMRFLIMSLVALIYDEIICFETRRVKCDGFIIHNSY